MRETVAEKIGVRAGDLVRIAVKMRRNMEVSRVSVWVRERPDLPYSPYVDPDTASWLDKGRPSYNRPFTQRLHVEKRSHTFEFEAYTDLDVKLIHEVDTNTDPKPIVRIKTYGTVAQTIRRFFRDSFRTASRYFASSKKD